MLLGQAFQFFKAYISQSKKIRVSISFWEFLIFLSLPLLRVDILPCTIIKYKKIPTNFKVPLLDTLVFTRLVYQAQWFKNRNWWFSLIKLFFKITQLSARIRFFNTKLNYIGLLSQLKWLVPIYFQLNLELHTKRHTSYL